MKIKTAAGHLNKWARRHKIIAGLLLVVILWVGYSIYKKATSTSGETRYVLTAVEKGTLVISVTGSGQVSVLNQVDVKPKASGDVIILPVAQGQYVGAGQLIAQLDTKDAEKAVRDAQVSLESSQLSFEKLKQSSADIDSILEGAFADISNAFLDFPTIVSNAEDIILSDGINPRKQDNGSYYEDFVGQMHDAEYLKISALVDRARADYRTARADYDTAFSMYKNATRYSDAKTIEDVLADTLAAAKSIAQALKSEQNTLDFLTDFASDQDKTVPALVTTYKNTLRTDIGLVNSHLSNLSATDNAVKNAPLDIHSAELTIQQRQNSLADAEANLADYSVRAPFAGILAKLNIKRGDSVSTGTVIATVITSQQTAEITLNEIDVAKVKIGERATLTFDAVPELTITGLVTKIDTIGTVSQGVVNYVVEIVFDTQDSRIKPGMSVTAAIIIDSKPDVLLVPTSAVKTQNNASYIEILDAYQKTTDPAALGNQGVTSLVAPRRQEVAIGLASDTQAEIISGLNESDLVVSRTIAPTAAAPTTQAPSIFGGGNRGGAVRLSR